MKALVMNSQGRSEEAFPLAKAALLNDMNSHICWHVYGLLHRSARNIEEAVKAYKRALKIVPGSAQIMRDLALLQMQIRDYNGYIETRKAMLQSDQSGQRQSWSALAAGYQLSGDLEMAEKTLDSYNDTFKRPPPPTDLEHAEMSLYKNTIIAERGDFKRALDHLDTIYNQILDRTLVMELRAKYLLKLGEFQKARNAFKALLERNSDNRSYFIGLEQASQLDRKDVTDHAKLAALYESLSDKYPGSDAARRIPLDFLTGQVFETKAEEYVRRQFKHAVPLAFSSVKGLYVDDDKAAAFARIVDRFISDSKSEADELAKVKPDLLFFVAQHYDHSRFRDLAKAMEYVDAAIAISPKSVDLFMTKGRILKHQGDITGAAAAMNQGRELEPKDRHVSTKSSKYYLRDNDNDTALSINRPFLRPDAPSGPIGDLVDMQSIWFMIEDGGAWLRQGNYNLALKRLMTVATIFETWYDDQFDFHAFAFRKGQPRPYIDLIQWEDSLRNNPQYNQAALPAIGVYLLLADHPELAATNAANGVGAVSHLDEKTRKQASKRAAQLRERSEKELKELERKAASKPTVDGESKRPDKDPLGMELLQTKTPLDNAAKLLRPMLEFSPDMIAVQKAAFEVYIRQKKYVPALDALNAAAKIDSTDPNLHVLTIRFRLAIEDHCSDLDSSVSEAISSSAVSIPDRSSLESFNDDFLAKEKDTPLSVLAGLKARLLLNPESKDDCVSGVTATIDLPAAKFPDGQAGLALLKEWKCDNDTVEAFKAVAKARWPQVSAFSPRA